MMSRFWIAAAFALSLGATVEVQALFRGTLQSETPFTIEFTPSAGTTAVTLVSVLDRGRFGDVVDLTATADLASPTTRFDSQLKADVTRLLLIITSTVNNASRVGIIQNGFLIVDATIADGTLVFNVVRP